MKDKFKRGDFSAGAPYFILMIFFALVCAVFGLSLKEKILLYFAAVQAGVALICFIVTALSANLYKRRITRMMDSISKYLSLSDNETLNRYPMPVAVIRIDSGDLVWSNERFRALVGGEDGLADRNMSRLVEGFSTKWLTDGTGESTVFAGVGDRKHMVYGSVMRSGAYGRVAVTFWADITQLADTVTEYNLSRPNVAILTVDNFADFVANMTDTDRSGVVAALDERVSAWVNGTQGLLLKTERDKYVYIFEERWLSGFTQKKFSLLQTVGEVMNNAGVSATMSIGVGHGGATFIENYQFANQSMDMALSRGGDQAVVKDSANFSFFGGRDKEVEKQTKVKVRVLAKAFGELVSDTSAVFVMGHKNADIDAIGSAAGVCCIARKRKVDAYIIVDRNKNDAEALIERLEAHPQYAGRLISAQEALMMADSRSLLVVVDTNRPSQVEAQELLLSFNRIVVIDHHRRAADYIERTTINYHEPFASSASEMLAEIMQYLVNPADILKVEADALLAGMVLDTKSFSVRTGGRTFEAAAFARRAGADTVEVKKLFKTSLGDAMERYDIIRSARLYRDDIAIAALDHSTDRALAAQAADELLTISRITASFVLYPDGQSVIISARSIGQTNVQVILEQLGGGGNTATAGAQLSGKTIKQALTELVASIDKFFEGQE